jgi:hypothetical protein
LFVRKFSVTAAALAAAVTISAVPASATIASIAVYNQVITGSTMRWLRAPAGTGGDLYTISSSNASAPGAATVNFSFLNPTLNALGALAATLTVNATSSQPAVPISSFLTEQGLTGTFAFTYAGSTPLVVGQTSYAPGANLLSGTFTNGTIVGATGGRAGTFSASTGAGSVITMVSDFLDLSAAGNHDLTIGLSSMTAPLGASSAQSALNTFRAATGGSFSSDSALVTAAIPEPASWALMVTGFGALGVAVRRRRKAVVTA